MVSLIGATIACSLPGDLHYSVWSTEKFRHKRQEVGDFAIHIFEYVVDK